MYGKPEVEEEYIWRMRHRGSTEEFVSRFGTIVASHYDSRTNYKFSTFNIELGTHEFVSDYVWNVFGYPKKYIGNPTINFNSYKIKTIFLDIDGTILDYNEKIGELTKEVIKEVQNLAQIIFVSARRFNRILPILIELGFNNKSNFCVAFNGSQIWRNDGELIFDDSITKTNAIKLKQFITKNKILNCLVYTEKETFEFEKIDDFDKFASENKIYKFVINESYENITNIKSKIQKSLASSFDAFCSASSLLEIVKKGVNKGSAVKNIIEMLNLDASETLAIGDSENDLSMFESVGTSVAVCSAETLVKHSADFITDSRNDDGVGKALAKFFKINL